MGKLKQNRYFSFIVSLMIWLMILAAGFWVSYQWSKDNVRALEHLDYIGDMSDAMFQVAARANYLASIDKNDSEKREQLLQMIEKHRDEADQNFNALMSDYEIISKLGIEDKLGQLSYNWKVYKEKIDKLKLNNPADELDLANYVDEYLDINYALIEDTYYDYFNESERMIEHTNNLQAGLAIFSIVYFIFLILNYFKRFVRADTKLAVAQREMSEIMRTVNSGLFLLEKDLRIGQLQSHRLGDFLGQDNLTGVNLVDALKLVIRDPQLLQTIEQFIEQLYNPKVKEKLIESLNPLSSFESHLQGVRRYLRFDFKRVYEGNTIIKVLVNISDITSDILLAEQLKAERSSGSGYLTMFKALQSGNSTLISEFLLHSKRNCLEINRLMREQCYNSDELRLKMEKMWRLVHALKGEASALKLKIFEELCEKFEEELKEKQQQSHLAGEHFLSLVVYLDELISLTQVITSLMNIYHPEISVIHADDDDNYTPPTLESQSTYYQELASDVAERKGKKVRCVVEGTQIASGELRSVLRSIAVQIVRNAVVHGIETPAERSAVGKNETGMIRIRTIKKEKALYLEVEDDGRGLDYEAIRQKAIDLGWFSREDAQHLDYKALLVLMFRSQLSTADKQDGDAGRGVGLDVVKHTVQAHGGHLKVCTEAGKFTRFTFIFPQ